ncbi:unnamed protein product [Aphanomyces euteiches]|uniref:subtilisin n=1 Tax=Aphanomyces euteiches TaxID=100861 RepID=A0A6G0WTE9_9STRA|nr:hypothetical protein Ae201684_011876 [Aphanomyces euteiches]KAH9089339.1 hypothetical protein Ae201684P_001539 [Aphanomyces euteiches]KAH9154791.1 hypothetical protein AeRB84_003181 [Aphanomyces euteiches]
MRLIVWLLVAVSLSALHAVSSPRGIVCDKVYRALSTSPSVNLLIQLDGTAPGVAQATQSINAAGPSCNKALHVRRALQRHCTQSQSCVARILASQPSCRFRAYWIANAVYVQRATLHLVQRLSECDNVSRITLDPSTKLHVHAKDLAISIPSPNALKYAWGVSKIGAPDVWSSGNFGQGVVVGSIDTGVLHTHEALAGKWRQDHGWYDPAFQTKVPNDANGHGTHTMGTILGGNGIGVAPNATYIACLGCPNGTCTASALLECAEFLLCPTDPDGSNPDCSLRPDVINNSWGGIGANPWFDDAILAWRQADIIPVFSIGNSGSKCATANSPGDSSLVIGVGATGSGNVVNGDDSLAFFSSRGRGTGGVVKPDVAAPGYFVFSAVPTDNSSYQYWAGTSMAAPHVTGAIALYLAANPQATYDEVYEALKASANKTALVPTKQNCAGVSDQIYPNNNYGHGRIDIARAVTSSAGGSTAPVASTGAVWQRAASAGVILQAQVFLPDF